MHDHTQLPLRRHAIAQLDMYDVTEDELDRIERESMDVGQDFQFASICCAAGVSFLIALLVTEIKSTRTYNSFLIVTILGFGGALYFWLKYWRKRGSAKTVIQRIRERKVDVGPVGVQDHELRVAELVRMPQVSNVAAVSVSGPSEATQTGASTTVPIEPVAAASADPQVAAPTMPQGEPR